jgi:hypothetical protein
VREKLTLLVLSFATNTFMLGNHVYIAFHSALQSPAMTHFLTQGQSMLR